MPKRLRMNSMSCMRSSFSEGFIPAAGSSSSSNLGRVAMARTISNRR